MPFGNISLLFRSFGSRTFFLNLCRYMMEKRRLIGAGGASLVAAGLWTDSNKRDLDPSGKRKMHSMDEIIERADLFYSYYLIDNVYNGLMAYVDSDNSELLWRLGRACCEKGKLATDKAQKAQLFQEALRYAKRAVDCETDSGCFAAHKWYAIIINYASEMEGRRRQLEVSEEVREHLERALHLEPGDPTTWSILGQWHFTFASMSTATRYLASLIFVAPPQSTYEQAMACFEKAETLQPGFYSKNTWYMAEIYYVKGETEKAIDLYRQAFQMPVVTIDDREVHENCFKRLKQLRVDIQ